MSNNKPVGPFGVRKTYQGQDNFDKYYFDVTEKDVFKATGEKDPETGDELGVIEKKLIVKKIDIHEYLESQRDSVGVEAYMKALAYQGDDIGDFNTQVDGERIDDYSKFPESLADVMMSGEKAKEIFDNLDPTLKGSHTTIEGFLNSLSKETLDAYILSRIEVLTGSKNKETKEGE